MSTLILDFSPILYSNFISASMEMTRNGYKADPETGKLSLDNKDYVSIIKYKVFEELSQLKTLFKADEIVIAADNSKGGYWRKDVYPIYKGQRKKGRDESNLDWNAVFTVFDDIKDIINSMTTFKLIDIPRVEGDDVMFVLSEYLSRLGTPVILHSVDHDTVYNLKNPGVTWWRHVKTAKKPGAYQDVEPGEILNLELGHIIQGDAGDNIKNIKSFSVFSKKFKDMYPNRTELEVYHKRFELDEIFEKTYNESAYKHPRYGLKTFMRSKKTIDELLNENEIYKMNYLMNRTIALPEGIPQDISSNIIEAYNTVPTIKKTQKLQEFFMNEGCFELIGSLNHF